MDRVLLFLVTDNTGYYYTENVSDIVLTLHDMRIGRAEPRDLTIEPFYVSRDEADILIGEHFEKSEANGHE